MKTKTSKTLHKTSIGELEYRLETIEDNVSECRANDDHESADSWVSTVAEIKTVLAMPTIECLARHPDALDALENMWEIADSNGRHGCDESKLAAQQMRRDIRAAAKLAETEEL